MLNETQKTIVVDTLKDNYTSNEIIEMYNDYLDSNSLNTFFHNDIRILIAENPKSAFSRNYNIHDKYCRVSMESKLVSYSEEDVVSEALEEDGFLEHVWNDIKDTFEDEPFEEYDVIELPVGNQHKGLKKMKGDEYNG